MSYYKILLSRLLVCCTVSMFWLGANAQDNTSKKQLPESALYIIDDKEATKEQAEKLDERTIKSVNFWNGAKAIEKFGDKGKNGVVVITTSPPRVRASTFDSSKKDFSDYDVLFTKVEHPATFPGGADGWSKYVETNLRYPEMAKTNKTEGVVRIQMVVDKAGNITKVQALNDPGDGLTEEAMRLIKKGPKWVPAIQNGRNVNYRFVQPVTFKL